jgi:hypothetical protein
MFKLLVLRTGVRLESIVLILVLWENVRTKRREGKLALMLGSASPTLKPATCVDVLSKLLLVTKAARIAIGTVMFLTRNVRIKSYSGILAKMIMNAYPACVITSCSVDVERIKTAQKRPFCPVTQSHVEITGVKYLTYLVT